MRKNAIGEAPAASRPLGPLEQEIMDLLWTRGGQTGKEIFEGVKLQRGVALTTVLTVVERLHKKGLIKKTRGESVYIFSAACTRDEFSRRVSNGLMRDILELSANGAFASFVDAVAERDPAELERLKKLIDRKREEMKSKRRS